jgi:hypothetical protein
MAQQPGREYFFERSFCDQCLLFWRGFYEFVLAIGDKMQRTILDQVIDIK